MANNANWLMDGKAKLTCTEFTKGLIFTWIFLRPLTNLK